ncbi:phage N-6-adenine-methyltransferase [Paraburkholderia atlantica]|uniref:DNA N-6-adenine-methyltransferase n=1 Tax=Paraburkholderia atlantica TaxID=2654982 RepID=UPI003D1C51B9
MSADHTARVSGSDGKTYPASYAANRAAIRAAIEADPQATTTAIAKRLGTTRDTVYAVRRSLCDAGALASIDATCSALAVADNIEAVKDIRDKAKAIQEYAREARDTSLFGKSTRLFMEAERRAGELLVAMRARNELAKHGGKRRNRPVDQETGLYLEKSLNDLGITSRQAKQWEKLAGMPDDIFSEQIERSTLRVVAMFDPDAVPENHRALGTGENEWYTPPDYIEAARRAMGSIDLDPASSAAAQKVVQATRYFDAEMDGLAQTWTGNVWLNPPYSQPAIARFADKAVLEVNAGNVAQMITLTHNYTDTSWWHALAGRADAICFTRGRIGFLGSDGEVAAPTQGQTFCYIGRDVTSFTEQFSAFGLVMVAR